MGFQLRDKFFIFAAVVIQGFLNVHNCQLTNNQYPFNVIPGSGWDNLMNHELGQVLKISYKKCVASNDGSFLIPDNSFLSPKKMSVVQLNSDLFEHVTDYTSLTSKSINTEASLATPNYQISGSFSWENKNVKENQVKEKSSVSRVQLRYELYTISFQPDCELDSRFRDRILDIGSSVKDGTDSLYPQYLADLLIRDFGTHVIRSAEVGAILSKTDILKSDYLRKYAGSTTKISAAAAFSMTTTLGINLSGGYAKDTTDLNEYNTNCVNTEINTLGGKPFGSNFTLQDWEKSMESNLVSIDRRGDPLSNVITPRNMPEFDDQTLYEIARLIKDATHRYYSANTRVGCMNMNSPNFNDDANVDSGTCQDPEMVYNLGGVYQSCYGHPEQCEGAVEENPATENLSCPPEYRTVKLDSGQHKCSQGFCSEYTLYWCAPNEKTPTDSGSLFGGIYTTSTPNPATNSFGCPQNFRAFKFGMSATICLSSHRDNGKNGSLPFGGFYSCSKGNPLSDSLNTNSSSKSWSKRCPAGFSSHVATISRGCQISYCIKTNVLSRKEHPVLQRPPFIDLEFGPNATTFKTLDTPAGHRLSLKDNGQWEEIPRTQPISYSWLLSSILGALGVLVILIVLVAVFVGRYSYHNRTQVIPK